jgi:hypothetical protein
MAIALLGLSASTAAQPSDGADLFCRDLRRVVAAAGETPAFASLPAEVGESRISMFGFSNGCGRFEARGLKAFGCYRQLPPPELEVDVLAAQIARCLPMAERLPDAGPEGLFREHVVRFLMPGATIEAAEGGWQTAGGGRVTLVVRPDR